MGVHASRRYAPRDGRLASLGPIFLLFRHRHAAVGELAIATKAVDSSFFVQNLGPLVC